jgi:hypothetical protein
VLKNLGITTKKGVMMMMWSNCVLPTTHTSFLENFSLFPLKTFSRI